MRCIARTWAEDPIMVSSIVHLSDLHLGNEGDASWNAFNALSSTLQHDFRAAPLAAIIVSGDLGNHPNERKFLKIKDKLEDLCRFCDLDPAKQLIVIPGNHDYRPYGLFGGWLHSSDTFSGVFHRWNKPRYLSLLGGLDVAIFCFDSNTSKSNVNFARGKVGGAELNRFRDDYDQLERQHAGFNKAFKIAVVHHHPLPIAAAETSHFDEAFLGLEDAGTFLRELVRRRQGIDLVLHGHKHFPAFGRVKIFTENFGEREISILAAGSACKPEKDAGGNSFNIISVKDGSVSAERWFRDTGGFARQNFHYHILSYKAARERSFENYCKEPSVEGVQVEREVHEFQINEYGDCQRSTLYDGISVGENCPPLEYLVLDKRSTAGQFANINVSESPTTSEAIWKPDPSGDKHRLVGKIVFAPPVEHRHEDELGTWEKTRVKVDFRVFNSFAMSVEQGKLMYGDHGIDGDSKNESVMIAVKRPTVELEIMVRFHESMPPPAVRIKVVDEHMHSVPREEAECRKHLMTLDHAVSLKVPKPRAGHRYGFSWPLPSRRSRASLALGDEAAVIRRRLLRLDTEHLGENPLQPVLQTIHREIFERFKSSGDTESDFELAVLAFDDTISRLRYVAGIVHPAYWSFRLLEGEGIAGRAHKQNASILYVREEIVLGEDYSAPPPPGCHAPEFLWVIPLRYPLLSETGIVGLLSLSTVSTACGLLRLRTNPAEFERLTEYLYSQCYENGILRMLLPNATSNPPNTPRQQL